MTKILFVGDLVPISPINLSDSIKQLFSIHRVIANLEGVFGDGCQPINKAGPHVNLNIECFKTITPHLYAVTLANNHSMDYGERGLLQTQQILYNYGIIGFGAGKTIIDASKILLIDDIAIISICEHEFGKVTETSSGTFTIEDELLLFKMIRDLKQRNISVIICYHGGTEIIPIPPPYIRKRFKLWIEYGADLIIGNHPHVPQGLEIYNDKPLIYSLGNFFFPNEEFKNYENYDWSLAVSYDTIRKICSVYTLSNQGTVDNIDKSQELLALSDRITGKDYNQEFDSICGRLFNEWYGHFSCNPSTAYMLHFFRCDAHKNMIQRGYELRM